VDARSLPSGRSQAGDHRFTSTMFGTTSVHYSTRQKADLCDVRWIMAELISPSPIIGVFVSEAHASFPESESGKLAAYGDAIAKTTSEGDHHRARLCVDWAIKMSDDKDQKHPRWEQFKELHQIWKDTWFGIDFGLGDAVPLSGTHGAVGKAEPIEDVRIQWVENAVAVAKTLGEDDGWDHSPWEALLKELIAYKKD